MLTQNDPARKLLRVKAWHDAGYKGAGNVVILDGNDGKPRPVFQPYLTDVMGTATESGHASNVAQVIHEFAPDAHIYYLDNTRNKDAVFEWVKANKDRLKVRFINVSLAGLRGWKTDGYLRYQDLGITLVCGAGNDDSEDWISYPARYDGPTFIAVGAASRSGTGIAGYSNEGEGLDVVVPSGVYIQREDGYIWSVHGTSFAAPTVTALLQVYAGWRESVGLPDLTVAEVEAFARREAMDIMAPGYDTASGFGLFRLPAAIPTVPVVPVPTPPPAVEPTVPTPEDYSTEGGLNVYPVTKRYLTQNRTYLALAAEGATVHSTATPGATDENEFTYFNGADRNASGHTFIDWDSITEMIPWSERAEHAGKTANSKYIGVELCEPYDTDPDRFRKFDEVWKRAVWYFADMFVKKGWGLDELHSHKWVSETYHETGHTDPYGYFKKYGKTFGDFNDDVAAMIAALQGGADDMLDEAILKFSSEDEWSAKDIDAKRGGIASFTRQGTARAIPAAALSAKKLYIIGGGDVPAHPNRAYMSGVTKYDTAAAVGEALKDGRI